MSDATQVKVGDMFINSGVPNKVYDIRPSKNLEGKTEPYVFYRSCFPEKRGGVISRSIPLVTFSAVRQRDLLNKTEIKEMLEKLHSKEKLEKEPIEIEEANDMLRSPSLQTRLELMKRLWQERKTRTTAFPYSKRAILAQLIDNVVEEVAVVLKVKPEQAEKKIIARLEAK